MNMFGAFVRLFILVLVLSTLFFAGMFVFTLVVTLLAGLAVIGWLRRNKVLNEGMFSRTNDYAKRVEDPTIVESKVFEAEYTEIDRRPS